MEQEKFDSTDQTSCITFDNATGEGIDYDRGIVKEFVNNESVEGEDYRGIVKEFMTRPYVENIFLALILINSIMMGIATFDFITKNASANAAFYYFDLIFLIIFTVESGLTIFYLRRGALTNYWVLFDSLIIFLSWISSATGRFDPAAEGTSVQVVRSLRMFRILNKVEALKIVLVAVSQSLARLVCLSIFCFVVMFIFAIYFTEQFG